MRSGSPQVAVLVETSTTWGAKIVQGVADYAREHGYWSIFVEPRGVNERLHIPRGWRGSGIIARVTTQGLAREVEALRVPCVNISWSHVQGSALPQVIPDEEAVGTLAAQHLIDRGFRRFAYVGLPDQPHYVDRCGPAFARALAGRGWDCPAYRPCHVPASRGLRAASHQDLVEWLAGLPRPVGVLAWDSGRGRRVAEACLDAGLEVPEEVGILSGYNDELMCEIATPPLSCIDHFPERVGREAAALLSRLMEGESPPSCPILIPPAGIIARRSTDATALSDPLVSEAVSFIRKHAHEPIKVEHLLAVVPCSRRALEQRFAKTLGRSPAAEIRRTHVARALELLARTDLSIARVAAASGFNSTEVMNRVFRHTVGLSPAMHRSQFRPRARS